MHLTIKHFWWNVDGYCSPRQILWKSYSVQYVGRQFCSRYNNSITARERYKKKAPWWWLRAHIINKTAREVRRWGNKSQFETQLIHELSHLSTRVIFLISSSCLFHSFEDEAGQQLYLPSLWILSLQTLLDRMVNMASAKVDMLSEDQLVLVVTYASSPPKKWCFA